MEDLVKRVFASLTSVPDPSMRGQTWGCWMEACDQAVKERPNGKTRGVLKGDQIEKYRFVGIISLIVLPVM